jgi:two-component system chemotaxis response regulator CheY
MAASRHFLGNAAVRMFTPISAACGTPPFFIKSDYAILVPGGEEFAAWPLTMGTTLVDPTIPILVVDDSLTSSRIVHSILRQAGFTSVGHVQDGHAALERLRAGNISLVIARWKLSPMSGLQLLHRVRKEAAMDSVRFVLISASSHPQLTDTVRRLGANGCLLGPSTAQALQQTIEQAFA